MFDENGWPDGYSDIDYNELAGVQKELIIEAIIEEFFGGVSKEDIIDLLQENYPDNF